MSSFSSFLLGNHTSRSSLIFGLARPKKTPPPDSPFLRFSIASSSVFANIFDSLSFAMLQICDNHAYKNLFIQNETGCIGYADAHTPLPPIIKPMSDKKHWGVIVWQKRLSWAPEMTAGKEVIFGGRGSPDFSPYQKPMPLLWKQNKRGIA